MGKPQPTQLPNYQNYQNAPKVKNSNLMAPPLIVLWFKKRGWKISTNLKKKKCYHPLNKIIQNPTNLNLATHFLKPHIFPWHLIAKKMQEKQNSNFLNNQTLPKK